MRRINKNSSSFFVDDESESYNKFWDAFENGNWEPFTLPIFDLLVRGSTDLVVDIGTWIGPTTLYAAAKGARVIGFEPDVVAFDSICKSIAINEKFSDRISILNVGVSDRSGPHLFCAQSGKFGESMSSLEIKEDSPLSTVSCIDAADVMENYGNASLIKIDIEGGEYRVIPRLLEAKAARKPPLYVSMHPHMIYSGQNYEFNVLKKWVKFLDALSSYAYIYAVLPDKIVRMTLDFLVQDPKYPVSLLAMDFPLKPA